MIIEHYVSVRKCRVLLSHFIYQHSYQQLLYDKRMLFRSVLFGYAAPKIITPVNHVINVLDNFNRATKY